jgi:glycosyltransferase involved in cell wall biosynthesis
MAASRAELEPEPDMAGLDQPDATPHVVYVCNPPWMGGAEEFLVRMVSNVREAGWRATVVLPDRPYLQSVVQRLRAIGVQVLPSDVKTERDYPIPALWHLADLRQRAWLKRTLQSLQPDLVHVNQPIAESVQLGVQAAASLGLPIVTTVHQYKSVRVRGHKLGRLRDRIINWHYRHVRAISLPAGLAARVLEQQYSRTRGKTCVVPPAIDVEHFDPDRVAHLTPQWRVRLDPTGEKRPVGVIARLSKEKGHRNLLAVWPQIHQKVPNAQLILAGDGPDRPIIEALCRDLRIEDSVTLLGHVAPQDIPALLTALDVVVQPSVHECLPLAMLEAMVMGRPMIAAAVDAIPDVLTHEYAGLLVPPNDSAALVEAVVRLLRDSALAATLGRQARQVVLERFTPAVQTREVLNLYQRVLSVPERSDEFDVRHLRLAQGEQ